MVKKLTIVLLFSYLTNSFAGVNIAFEKRDINGLKQIAIVIDKSEFYTNSNELELYSTQKIGKFKINLKTVPKQINNIEKIYKALIKIDTKLKEVQKSFNTTYKASHHAPYIKLGSFKVPISHPYYIKLYDELEDILSKTSLKSLNTVEYKFGKKGPELLYKKKGHKIKRELVSLNFLCKKRTNERICLIDKFGHIVVSE
tara:strand:+ start:18 stop:617 length:600 start_codon:yes stop_codon:yes gene_type:complete